MESEIKNVGFIGLGVMGKPMARNLMKAGYKLTVKSRRPGPVDELVAEGAKSAATPREVAEASDLVITMLPNSPEVKEVCLGANGIIEAAKSRSKEEPPSASSPSDFHPSSFILHPSLTVVDMSTISPNVSKEIGHKLAEAGIDYLEAPVSGGDIGAIKGTLSIMAGGPKHVFNRVLPVFKALGKSAVRLGEWGAGQTTKIANNIICATTIEAVAEALVLVAKAGVDPEKMYEAIKGGAAACWSLDNKVPKVVARDFKPGFMVKLHLKDLNLALDAARELNMKLPITERVREMLKDLNEQGLGDDDNCSLVKVIEKMAGVEVQRLG